MTLSLVILPAKVLSNGTHKIRISVAHNGQTRYIPTRFIVPSQDCLKNGVVTSKVSNASYINIQLRNQLNNISSAYDLIEDAECYTCSQIITLINEKTKSRKPMTFEQVAEEWMVIKRVTCKPSSCSLYNVSIQSFIAFAGNGFIMQMLNSKKIWEYDTYLSNNDNSNTTINIRMSVLRGITNLAIKRKYVKYEFEPFGDYKSRNRVIRDCLVPVEIVRKIRDFKPNNFALQRAADIFMLSFYLAGMNLADMLNMRLDGDCVSFIRTKTITRRNDNLKTEFTIQPEARAIINKYINDNGVISLESCRSKRRNKIITIKSSCGDIDKNLKLIANKIGYDGNIILYSARKTFAQLGFLHNVQERVIAYCIGDSTNSRGTMSHYINANKQLADECIRKVLDFLNSDKTEKDLFGSNKVVQ